MPLSATTQQDIEKLIYLAKQEIEKQSYQPKLFGFETDEAIEKAFSFLSNANIRTVTY